MKLGPRRNYHKGQAASRGLLRDCTTGCGTDGALYSTTANPSLTPVTGHWTTLQAWKVPIEIDDGGGGGCLDPALNTAHPILLATAATSPVTKHNNPIISNGCSAPLMVCQPFSHSKMPHIYLIFCKFQLQAFM